MNSPLIDVALGIALTFAVFSTVCTVATEWWSRIRQQRSEQLEKSIRDHIIGDRQWAKHFLSHPLIESLNSQKWKFFAIGAGRPGRPSYIPATVFALVMIDLAFESADAKNTERRSGPAPTPSLELIPSKGTGGTVPDDLHTTLRALTNGTRNSFQHTQERIETWFNESMERLTGQYTRYAHTVTLVGAIFVTLVFNVDSVRVAQDLYENPNKASAAATIAAKLNPALPEQRNTIVEEYNKISFPVGWGGLKPEYYSQDTVVGLNVVTGGWLSRIVGWLISIVGLSMGGPFWFDLLNRIMRLRQAGTPPGK